MLKLTLSRWGGAILKTASGGMWPFKHGSDEGDCSSSNAMASMRLPSEEGSQRETWRIGLDWTDLRHRRPSGSTIASGRQRRRLGDHGCRSISSHSVRGRTLIRRSRMHHIVDDEPGDIALFERAEDREEMS